MVSGPRRKEYLDLPSLGEALARVEEATAHLVPRAETVEAADSAGRALFAPLFARLSAPAFSCAAMDGIAVAAESTFGASETDRRRLRAGVEFDPVDTGDPLPPGRDAVIMIEETVRLPDGGMEIAAPAAPWQHVRPAGEDFAAGELVLPARHVVRPVDLGVLLQAGLSRVEVCARPRAVFLPTGSELVPADATPARGQIVESNGAVARALLAAHGAAAVAHAIVPDEPDLLGAALDRALEEFDVVLIGAGSSAGRDDHTATLIAARGELIVRGVAIRPAKPVLFGICRGKPVFGVPGYPVSTVAALELFAVPLVRRIAGLPPLSRPKAVARLTRRVASSLKHEERVPCRVAEVHGRLVAAPLSRGAGVTTSLSRANAHFTVPRRSEGFERGAEVACELADGAPDLSREAISIGSHDPALDLLAGRLAATRGAALASTHAGSLGGLLALAAGECHLAPIHLLDPETDAYNLPAVARYAPARPVALLKFLRRMQGLLVAPGNPLRVGGLADLARVRFVNRQRGSGTRALLDAELARLGIDPAAVRGYTREATTHPAVAEAVKLGEADAGLAVQGVAAPFGLDFLPVREEEYDLAIAAEALDHPAVVALLAEARSAEFARDLARLPGYRSGTLELIAAPWPAEPFRRAAG